MAGSGVEGGTSIEQMWNSIPLYTREEYEDLGVSKEVAVRDYYYAHSRLLGGGKLDKSYNSGPIEDRDQSDEPTVNSPRGGQRIG